MKDRTVPVNEASNLIYFQIRRMLPTEFRLRLNRDDFDDLLGGCRWAYAEWLALGQPTAHLDWAQKKAVSRLAQRSLHQVLRGLGWRRVRGQRGYCWRP